MVRMLEIIRQTFSNNDIVGAISSALLIIMLGYLLRVRGIFGDTAAKNWSQIAMEVGLPALSFLAFMQDINHDQLSQSIHLLIFGFFIYIVLFFVTWLLFIKYKSKDKRDVLELMSAFGSVTFYGTPIALALYGPIGVMYASIFNISYRVYLYSYGILKMTNVKFKKENIKKIIFNPVLFSTLLGLLVWVFQNNLPQVNVLDQASNTYHSYAFLRIDKTAPFLFVPMTFLSAIASPLAWLSIGTILGSMSLKDSISNATAWYFSLVKLIIIPIVSILLMVGLKYLNILSLDSTAVGVIVILMAAPAATVTTSMAIGFGKEPLMASNNALVSTIIGIILTPFWIVLIDILKSFLHILS